MQETGEAIILCEGSAHLDQCNYEQEGGLFGLCVCVHSEQEFWGRRELIHHKILIVHFS